MVVQVRTDRRKPLTRTKAALLALLMVVMMVTALGITAMVEHSGNSVVPATCTVSTGGTK